MGWLRAETWEVTRARGQQRYLLTDGMPTAIGITVGMLISNLIRGFNLPLIQTVLLYLLTFLMAYLVAAFVAIFKWRHHERKYRERNAHK
jgi:uncharacterized protein YacL